MGSASRVDVIVGFSQRAMGAQKFTVSERIIIVNSAARLRAAGIVRTELHTVADHGDPQFGDFLLFYRQGESWSRWGLGCCGRNLLLWRSVTGRSCGYFESLDEAMDALIVEVTSQPVSLPKRPAATPEPLARLLSLVPVTEAADPD